MDWILVIVSIGLILWIGRVLLTKYPKGTMSYVVKVLLGGALIGVSGCAVYHFGDYHHRHMDGIKGLIEPYCVLEKYGHNSDCFICEVCDKIGFTPYVIGETHKDGDIWDIDARHQPVREAEEDNDVDNAGESTTQDNSPADNQNNGGSTVATPYVPPTPSIDVDVSSSNEPTRCPTCNGSTVCTSCRGNGGSWQHTGYYTGDDSKSWIDCPSCRGSGKCYMCYGKGHL